MLSKTTTIRLRKSLHLAAYLYRLPVQVRGRVVFQNGDSYPICPRCDELIDREYICFCNQCGQRLEWSFFDYAKIVYAPRYK